MPLYLVLALIVLGSVGFATRWHVNESPFAVSNEVVRWLAGGALDAPEVNAYNTSLISAGVTWSLSYEWMFYASLIVTAFFARSPLGGALLPLVVLMIAILVVLSGHRAFEAKLALLFSVGMIAAAAREPLAAALVGMPQWVLSALAVGVVALALTSFEGMFDLAPELLLGAVFVLIVSGTTLFGLLLTRPARRLGDISYGIYLLQGPVLLLAFGSPALRAASVASPAVHWSLVAIAAAALTAFATVMHNLIERPGIQAGHWASKRVTAALRGRATAAEASVLIDEKGQQPHPL